jgi:hypothetical protein
VGSSGSILEIPGNVVLEKDSEAQLKFSNEKLRVKHRVEEERNILQTIKKKER